MRGIGLIIGKFYPFHRGHQLLINTALAESCLVLVVVLANDNESIPLQTRVDWIRDEYAGVPELVVMGAVDNLPVDYSSREADRAHAALIAKRVRHYRPDVVFSSEPYGERLAEDLGDILYKNVSHRMVDLDRLRLPISATAIRKNPAAYWDYLPAAVRATLAKRVVICGAESTGTTTLAKALATEMQTVVVPEMGRYYDWAVGKEHDWSTDDFLSIAEEQRRWEEKLARKSGPILVCDTDEFATAMFHEVYLGPPCLPILEQARATPADLYIITSHNGVPFEDDGTRFNSGRRPWMTDWFWDHLPAPRHITFGDKADRLYDALEWIDRLKWDFYEPVELGKNAA